MMLEALQLGAEFPALQYRAGKRDGTYVWVEIMGRALGGNLGAMLSLRETFRDASRRKTVSRKPTATCGCSPRPTASPALANRRAFDKVVDA